MNKAIKFQIQLETNGDKILRTLSVDANDFREAVAGAVKEAKSLNTVIENIALSGMALSALENIVGTLQDAVGALATEYNSFDKGMRAVNTMANVGKEELAGLKREVEELAGVIPLAKEELASGLYQVISNGVPKDNWISFLEQSARSSVGGLADLGQTVTVTSTIIKNYGLAWDVAGEIQDKIQMTAKNGVTSFEQLAQALPRVTGNAATLGVSVDELMATFATLTGVSGNTAEVSTQLAAVFTALVKPSSEASEMAQQMGVQFDAAAIQAAGGMQNFLRVLDMSISQYAMSHNMLEQEIYGKLFGSAEALRALIPLTGELSDTFTSNVSAMAESTGTIDQAFAEMSGSGEAVNRMLQNQLSTMLDWAGSIASSIQPYLSFVAVTGQAIAGMTLMVSSLKEAVVAIVALTSAQKKNAVVSALAAAHAKVVSLAQNLLAASSVTATAGTWALTAAVTALYAAATLGISVAITALVTWISSLGDESEEAAEKVDVLKESTDAFKNAAADAKAEIDMEVASLSNLIRQRGNESEKVEELNRKYGKAMGYHSTAAEWYKTLISKSKDYCTQIGYEAQARVLASQIAAKTLERDEKMQRYGYLGRQSMDRNGKVYYQYQWVKGGKEEYESLGGEINALIADIDTLQKRYDTSITRMTQASERLKAAEVKTATAADWRTMSYADLGREIEKQKTKVESLAGANAKQAQKEAYLLKQMKERYRKLGQDYGLSDDTAAKKQNKEKTESEPPATPTTPHTTVGIDQITTYEQLEGELAFYEKKLKTATQEERTEIQARIIELKKLQRAWDDTLAALDKPADISALNSMEEIDDAISYYSTRLNKASADEIAAIRATILALQNKRDALQNIADIPASKQEVDELGKLSGQKLVLELDAIGIDGIRAKIRSLQHMLDDTENPLPEEQKKDVEALIASWEGYEHELVETTTKGKRVQDAMGNLGSLMGNLSGVVGEGAGGWLSYGANILQAVAQAMPALAQVIGGNIAQAFSGAAAQSQTVPFPFNLIALSASMAAVAAAVASIPKFADGGIAYGPTLGIFGEYAGASNNPEVVAPLNKLKSIIGLDDTAGTGKVEFVIEGRTLRGILKKTERIKNRVS